MSVHAQPPAWRPRGRAGDKPGAKPDAGPRHEANIESGGGLACSWPTATGSSSTWTSSCSSGRGRGFIMAAVVASHGAQTRSSELGAVKRTAVKCFSLPLSRLSATAASRAAKCWPTTPTRGQLPAVLPDTRWPPPARRAPAGALARRSEWSWVATAVQGASAVEWWREGGGGGGRAVGTPAAYSHYPARRVASPAGRGVPRTICSRCRTRRRGRMTARRAAASPTT